MNLRSFSTILGTAALLLALALVLPFTAGAQTFRGAISGSVTDQSGAVVPGAAVEAVETATNASHKAISSSAGEFAFPDLAVGSYTVTVTASGFKPIKVDKVPVSAGATYSLPVKLGLASSGETIEVTADALAIDTATDTQSTTLAEVIVQNLPNSGRDFTQLIAQTPGFAGLSTGGGAGVASVNGTRSNSVNWQIEGTDNNDLWWNIPAVNQGGVSSIAGVILPIDAIENFSFVTAGSTDLGRNSGGTANLTIKSGTNNLHGSGYYYNHNEFFQHSNPFSTTGKANETRNQHYGFSVGGPIWKDKAFFFLGGEHQGFLIGASNSATEPSAAYQTEAYALLDSYQVPHNSVTAALLNGNGTLSGLWPSYALTGSAEPGNYTAAGDLTGHSFNGIIKLDDQLTEKDHIAFMWFVGQGTQTAPSSSTLAPYFENAPIHVENYSLVYNRVLTPSITNQLSAGVSYFNQVFGDHDTDFDPIGLGLNTGVTDPALPGSPHLCISSVCTSSLTAPSQGFDQIGPTAPSGRNDITGHLNENLSWTRGAHQMHFGGEFRQAQVDDFYQTGQRGQLVFDGTQGPWSSSSTPCSALNLSGKAPLATPPSDSNVLYLADFLAGCFNPSTTSIVLGDPKRQVFVNTFSLDGQDNWQVSKAFNLNFGVRYDYEGPVHSDYANLSVFDPSVPGGLAIAGQQVANIYKKFWGGVSPRVGFSYQLGSSGKDVLRGGFGLYYDSLYMKSALQNGDLTNISVFGVGLNPVGSNIVANANALSTTITPGGAIYPTLAAALAGSGTTKISTFDPKFRPPYTDEFDLNIQHSFTPKIISQIGYVGTKGTHLMGIFDINAGSLGSLDTPVAYNNPTCPPSASGATPGTPGNDLQCSRPYFSQFPNFSVIDEARSNLGSIYNSLQSLIRIQDLHGLAMQMTYTWSHALDYETGLMPYLPQDPTNEKAEYGNSDFDVRNTFNGYVDYTVPKFAGPEVLTKGWELNSGFAFHGGTPYTVLSSSNPSNNGEDNDRAVQVIANPLVGVSHAIVNVGGTNQVQWFNPNAFVDAPLNTYSPTRRGQNYNPGYEAIDLSVLKTTKVTERVSTEFKADIFNVFNHTNLGPVGLPTTGESGIIGETIGVFLGNPGFGPGEPLNVEFGLKILF